MPQIRRMLLKDGTVKVYEYKNANYFKDYYEKNKERINEKFTCDLCRGSYTLANKTQHHKSKRHMAFVFVQAEKSANKTFSFFE